MSPKVSIVILNWNGWADTIECLESVFRQDYDNYQVVICDNDSGDNSVERIVDWAEGHVPAPWPENHPLAALTQPPLPKPVPHEVLDREQAEQGDIAAAQDVPLVIIRTGGNLGFAGGNNVGLRFALRDSDVAYTWLLNNDTVVEPDALGNMVRYSSRRGKPNTCGSLVMFYDDPTVVQALGGARWNPWTAIASKTLGRFKSINDDIDHARAERDMDYITGCTWLLPRSFLEEIGLMEEGYFLYYEEIDWCLRGKDKYELCYAPDARVYHKEGSSIGSATMNRKASSLSDFYMFRNKFRVTRRFAPWALPTVLVSMFLQALNRARRGDLDRTMLIFRIMLGRASAP